MTIFQKHIARITGFATLLFAGVAHAQVNGSGSGGSGGSGTIGGNISAFLTFVNGYLVPLIFAVALLMFLWGIFRYFIAGGDSDENRKEGRTFILYAIIGFVLMSSIWGLVNLITGSVQFGSKSQPGYPTINQGTGGSQGTQNPPPQNPPPHGP